MQKTVETGIVDVILFSLNPCYVEEHYKVLKHHARECIKYGRCEKNCPFNVKIIMKMEEAVEIFGY